MEYKKNLSIELLRFILSILVVIHHLYWLYNKKVFNNDIFIDYIFNFMQIGVDVFFVISGFFIANSLLNRKGLDFLIHRIIRIVPLYFLISTFILFVMIYKPWLFNILPSDLLVAYLKSIFFIPFIDGNYQGPLLSVGWTLNYEVLFYLLSFLSVVFLKKLNFNILLVLLTILNISYFIFFNQKNNYLTNTIILEFLFGVYIYQHFNIVNSIFNKYKFLIIFFVFLLFILIYIAQVNIFDVNLRFIVGIIACIIFLFFYNLTLDFKTLRFFGELSYPIYLIHLPLIYLISKFTENLLLLVFIIGISLFVCSYISILFQRKINEFFIK